MFGVIPETSIILKFSTEYKSPFEYSIFKLLQVPENNITESIEPIDNESEDRDNRIMLYGELIVIQLSPELVFEEK